MMQFSPRLDDTRFWQTLGVRRASRQARPRTLGSGWAALDRALPGGGYPLGGVTELLTASTGIGEFSLLLLGLAGHLAAHPAQRIALVSPPGLPHAPALDGAGLDRARLPIVRCTNDGERLWAVEQMARSGGFCGFVLWSETLEASALRRLQLAAETADCPLFVYRDLGQARQRSPAALRLMLRCDGDRQHIEILKCRGPAGACIEGLAVDRDRGWTLPGTAISRITPLPACNDSDDNPHVARPAFSPLGPR